MEIKTLEKFAQAARRALDEQIAARLDRVLTTDSAELRGQAEALAELRYQIRRSSRETVVERAAYTWFNRFCALRFMDVNRYTPLGVVSPTAGFTQPELLQEAKQGVIDDDLARFVDRAAVADLLSGRRRSSDPQGEAYRLLLVGVCNQYHETMPFVFEPIADYTELLLPDDLLSAGSILQAVRNAVTPEACQDVEVIGWLYQFYVAEKKDEVFAGLKQGRKIAAEDIPAATQLFTPHWIVRYLVENSLGRLWLLNRPGSRLAEQMPYYIRPEQPETDFLRISSPEEIRLGDPAVGSGHMLTYAFDLLYLIYEEEGYNPPDIPRLILEKNLYGIEIDERAGALAAFALAMKARGRDRRFLKRGVRPNICVLRPVTVTEQELNEAPWFRALGASLVDLPAQDALLHDLSLFAQAGNIGSLLQPQLMPEQIEMLVNSIGATDDLLSHELNERVQHALAQLAYLARKYHVVIANPPYMSSSGANDELNAFLKDKYEIVKSDLFAAFIVRNLELTLPGGQLGFMSPFVWMFISSYEELRQLLIEKKTITSLIQLEYSGFAGATVPICTFTIENTHRPDFRGGYVRLSDFRGSENQGPKTLEAIHNPHCGWFYRAFATDFRKIPGSPIAYWISERLRNTFAENARFSDHFFSDGLTKTGDNDRYLRFHWEVFRQSAENENLYRICVKGGDARDYYGNLDVIVNWSPGARDHYRSDHVARITPQYLWYRSGISWTKISSRGPTFRWFGNGMIAETGGPAVFCREEANERVLWQGLGFLTSKLCWRLLSSLNPTLNFQTNDVLALPMNMAKTGQAADITEAAIAWTRVDWDSYETSWNFTDLPLLRAKFRGDTLADTYAALRGHWRAMALEMQRLEEENNRIFIDAYGLADELTPDVPLAEITLTCNPHYRYGGNKSEEELERLLQADTIREFISYAVGCMFGRYSLDKSGLVLANQGETIEDYFRQVPNPTFAPDRDNVIPVLDGDWFGDDIVARFRRFLRITFGEEHFAENLAFIEAGLGRDIRGYFVREFYDDHVRRYKKRPIYWLFSSPSGAFNALIYMHRYRPDTVSVVLNDYLRAFRAKLVAARSQAEHVSIAAAATPRERTSALKEVERLTKVINELIAYENEVLYPLATRQVAIDLDDGVKVNYSKLGAALRKITGLSA